MNIRLRPIRGALLFQEEHPIGEREVFRIGLQVRVADVLRIERPTFDGVRRSQPFSGGKLIVWHPQLGAF